MTENKRNHPSGPVMAFLQARMGSNRLPGKVLMPIQGQSILERAIRRLRASTIIDEVAVLTTCLAADDVIQKEAEKLGALVFRGEELDVLARFLGAVKVFHPGIVVRATADNPLIDIESVTRIASALRNGSLDYQMEPDLPYGAATEAVTAEALERTHLLAREPQHREHVTLHIKEHPELFLLAFPECPQSVRFPEVRVTVDTMDDFIFMNRLIGCLPEREMPVPLEEYIPYALTIMNERECKAISKS
jgi:spore coat polysaccharide biosynthesis protein SpsF